MREKRIKVAGVGVYHCMSRTVAGERLFDVHAKSAFLLLIRKAAAFCGVELLAYCVMDNHFHVLVRVDPRGVENLTRRELLRRYRAFFKETLTVDYPSPDQLEEWFNADTEEARRWEVRIRQRMGDVSEFMKTLKQHFTTWFNKTHQRYGTLWSERFRSVLVEDTPYARLTVAAYIELNPVRAGIVGSPADSPWTSFGQAVRGDAAARDGIARVVGPETDGEWDTAYPAYRRLLGEEFHAENASTVASTQRCAEESASPAETGETVVAESALSTVLRNPSSKGLFSSGGVVGSPAFVEEVAQSRVLSSVGSSPPVAPSPQSRGVAVKLPSTETMPLVRWRRPRHLN
jgi:REP element-mobilizing transposase RayT